MMGAARQAIDGRGAARVAAAIRRAGTTKARTA
jgi:hypothetical protein